MMLGLNRNSTAETMSNSTTISSTTTTGQQTTTNFPSFESFDDYYDVEPSSQVANYSDSSTTTPVVSFDWFESTTTTTATTTNPTITPMTETEQDIRESGFVVMNVTVSYFCGMSQSSMRTTEL